MRPSTPVQHRSLHRSASCRHRPSADGRRWTGNILRVAACQCVAHRSGIVVGSAVCVGQVAVPSDWQLSVVSQLAELRRWQRVFARGGPSLCICASCIRSSEQSAVADDEWESYQDGDVVGGLPHLPHPPSEHNGQHSPAVLQWPTCASCSQPMLFLLKINTTAGGSSMDEDEENGADEVEDGGETGSISNSGGSSGGSSRTLLFFCCSDAECEAQQEQQPEAAQQQCRRWRVWRLTEVNQPLPASVPQRQQQGGVDTDEYGGGLQRHQPLTGDNDSKWGISGDWDTGADDAHSCGGSNDADDEQLSATLEELILHRQHLAHSAHVQLPHQRQQQVGAATTETKLTASSVSTLPVTNSASRPGNSARLHSSHSASPSPPSSAPSCFPLQCARPFYLSWTVAGSATSVHSAAEEDSVVQRLLRQYRSQCGTDEQAEHLPLGSTIDASYDDLADEYERSTDSTFARFRRQINKQPQQRIRYRTQHRPTHSDSNSNNNNSNNNNNNNNNKVSNNRTDRRERNGSNAGSDSDSDSDSDSGDAGADHSTRHDGCLAADSRMRRGMLALSRSVCSECGVLRSFECQLLGSLVSDLADVVTGQPIALGWTTAALYTCRNAQCRVGQLVDETAGLLVAD